MIPYMVKKGFALNLLHKQTGLRPEDKLSALITDSSGKAERHVFYSSETTCWRLCVKS